MADDTAQKRGLWDRIRECLAWGNILDFAYVSWILRAPVVVLAVGLLVLGFAPQAQDLIVDLTAELGRVVLFLALLVAWVWVTIFCCYLLLEHDRRLRAHAEQISQPANNPRARWLGRSMRGMPYLLGALPFVIVLIATIRSGWNLPDIEDINVLDAVRASLAVFLAVLGLFFLVFLVYATGRPRRRRSRFTCTSRPSCGRTRTRMTQTWEKSGRHSTNRSAASAARSHRPRPRFSSSSRSCRSKMEIVRRGLGWAVGAWVGAAPAAVAPWQAPARALGERVANEVQS